MTALIALAPVGALAAGLAAGDAATLGALDAAHETGAVDLVVLGADTAGLRRGTPSAVRAIDPFSVAVARHARYPRWAFLAVAAPTRDHPYNLARRALGAWHLTSGRVGLLLADDDPGLPLDADGTLPWLPGTAPGPEVTGDAADALRDLWNSWPAGTIVGDRDSGVYARVEGVRRVDHRGAYRIAGPLGTPADERGEPVLGTWRPADTAAWAEVTLDDEVRVGGIAVGAVVRAEDVDGVPARARGREPHPGGLRDVLGLPARSRDLSDRTPLAGGCA